MQQLIAEIRKALESGYFRCALGMALTLPDICGQVEYPKEKSVGARYKQWCDNYLYNQGFFTNTSDEEELKTGKQKYIDSNLCYKLRCAVLHSGNTDLGDDTLPIFQLHLGDKKGTGIYIEKTVQFGSNTYINIDVHHWCLVLCNAAEEYYNNHTQKYLFENHYVQIDDKEEISTLVQRGKEILNARQKAKTDITSEAQLSKSAKVLLQILRAGLSIPDDYNLQNAEQFADIKELDEGGFLR